MSEHTPVPWELHNDYSVRICRADKSERGCIEIAEAEILGHTRDEANANAAFIVLAVNSHDDLLEALETFARFACDDGKPAIGCGCHNCKAAIALKKAKP